MAAFFFQMHFAAWAINKEISLRSISRFFFSLGPRYILVECELGVERTFLQAVAAIYSSLRRDDDGGIIHEICCHAVPYQQKENCLVA